MGKARDARRAEDAREARDRAVAALEEEMQAQDGAARAKGFAPDPADMAVSVVNESLAAGAENYAPAGFNELRQMFNKNKSRANPFGRLGPRTSTMQPKLDAVRAQFLSFLDSTQKQNANNPKDMAKAMGDYLHHVLSGARTQTDYAINAAKQAIGDRKTFAALLFSYTQNMHVALLVTSMFTRIVMRWHQTMVEPPHPENTDILNRRRGAFNWVAADGTAHRREFKSGTTENYNTFGDTAGSATEDQMAARMLYGYTGQGGYLGNFLGGKLASAIDRVPVVGRAFNQAVDLPSVASNAENRVLSHVADRIGSYTGSGRYDTKRRRVEDDDFSGDADERLVGGGPSGVEYNGSPYMPDGTVSTRPGERRFQGNQVVNPDSPFTRNPAQVYTTGDETGDLIVHHREYLRDITPTSSGFETQEVLELNAGLETSFPLLAKFSRYYGQYEFQSLIIRYRSSLSEGNESSTGTLAIATLYNPDSALYTSKRAIENAEYTSSGRVVDTIHSGIECDQTKMAHMGMYFVRRGPLGQANDLHTYDMGKVQIVTQGAKPGLPIGEVWVEYKVRLSKMTNTTLAEPLARGEGSSISTTYAGGVDAGEAVRTMYGTGEAQTASFPFPQWTGSTNHGQLQAPGVYRWSDVATGERAYVPGQGSAQPVATALQQDVPLIAGYSTSPHLGFAMTSPTDGQTSVSYAFQAVPGAVYTYAMTGQVTYGCPAFLSSYNSKAGFNYDEATSFYTGGEYGLMSSNGVNGEGGYAGLLSEFPVSQVAQLLAHRPFEPMGPAYMPGGAYNTLPSTLVVTDTASWNTGWSENTNIATLVARIVAASRDSSVDINLVYNNVFGGNQVMANSAMPGLQVRATPSPYGNPATLPINMNWGSVTFTVVAGPVRFVGGGSTVTVPISLVDGGQLTFNTYLLQAAMSMEVIGNSPGGCVLSVATHVPTNYESSFIPGVAFPRTLNAATQENAQNPSRAFFDVNSTAVSFKRVK